MSAQHTPGRWAWFGNARNNEIYLATTHSGRRYVMGFQRWGMKGAQPMFQPADRGLVPASDLLKFEVGDRAVTGVEAAKADESVYRLDISGIDCADARLIAAAPELLAALQAVVANSDRLHEAGHHRRGDLNELYDAAVAAIGNATGIPS